MRIRLLALVLLTLLVGCDGGDELSDVVTRKSPAISSRDAGGNRSGEGSETPKAAAETPRDARPEAPVPPPETASPPVGTSPGPSQPGTRPAPDAAPPEVSPPIAGETPALEVPQNYPGQDPNPFIRVQTAEKGEPFVVVNYPWQKLQRPSVQMVLVTDAGSADEPAPVALDGAALQRLWNEQLRQLQPPAVRSVEFQVGYGGGQILTAHGQFNALNKPSAYAVDARRSNLVVFYRPDTWADPSGVFYAGLRDLTYAPAFLKPGKLSVWVLDQEQVVMAETVDWPGEPAPPVAADSAAADPTPATEASTEAGAAEPPGAPAAGPGMAQPDEVAVPAPPEATPVETPAPPPNEPDSAGPAMEAPGANEPPGVMASPPSEPIATPAPEPATVPASPPAPATAAEIDWKNTPIDQLANHVERLWGKQMSPEARKAWARGLQQYRQDDNPLDVRLFTFKRLVKAACDSEPSDEVREALERFYDRLTQPGR